ncbi:MAG: sulfatase [Bryobacterales bacterium]|nr:sulfatase [Bryobacterales bacterium]
MMNRRSFIASAAAAGSACLAPRRPRPNILVLMPDQWRAMALGAMGNPDVRTPNMDALAENGTLLRNVTANCPVCCPARGTLLTGRFGHEHGVDVNDAPLPNGEVTIAEIARASGYRTAFAGKWHLAGGRRLPGFVEPGRRQGFDFWAANICTHNYWDMQYFRDSPEPIQIEGYSAAAFTDEMIGFIGQDTDTPFLAYLQWGPPHNPYVAPPEYMSMYAPESLTMRENWSGPVAPRAGRATGARDDIAGYYAAITFLDDEVGRIAGALKASGQFENTILLITSDHGDMLGSQGTYLKRKPWAESLQVPGIVHYPAAVPAGQQLALPASHVDIVPTLLGLAGLPASGAMSGTDLSPHLLAPEHGGDPTVAGPASVYAQSYTPTERDEFPAWRGVRTERYTYARNRDRAWLLYDNEADPFQLENLAGNPTQAAVQAELDDLTMDWFERTGDDWRERADLPYR